MKKLAVKIVLAIIAVCVLAMAADGLLNKFSGVKRVFGHQLSIDKTSNIVTQINKISEFTTACYYEELVIKKEKYRHIDRKAYKDGSSTWAMVKNIANPYEPVIVQDSIRTGSIVFIVKTKVRAGYDLSRIGTQDLTVQGDTLAVKLPDVQIFDIIANPSDWEVFHSDGHWEHDEIKAIQTEAKETIRRDAVASGLLERAESFGKESLVSLFKTFGFPEVILKN